VKNKVKTYRLLFAALDTGNRPMRACVLADMSYNTYCRWIEKDKKFSTAVKKHIERGRISRLALLLEKL